MNIISSDFEHGQEIPQKFGYNFENINPRLEISEIPPYTKSLALVMDDPDALEAVGKVWIHWLVCDIIQNLEMEKNRSIIIESGNSNGKLNMKNSAILGITDFGKIGYGGPAPPDKRHVYYFKIFALDIVLNLKDGFSKNDLDMAMQNHIIEESILSGTFTPT